MRLATVKTWANNKIVSIHAPVKDATFPRFAHRGGFVVSIHAPVKDATRAWNGALFIL